MTPATASQAGRRSPGGAPKRRTRAKARQKRAWIRWYCTAVSQTERLAPRRVLSPWAPNAPRATPEAPRNPALTRSQSRTLGGDRALELFQSRKLKLSDAFGGDVIAVRERVERGLIFRQPAALDDISASIIQTRQGVL